ncbi:hypothetical protein ONZ45_g7564 [Pleurotus djamor]|nr:hypothetical protein ONZ45_g7564 [Pleurotus djamor]
MLIPENPSTSDPDSAESEMHPVPGDASAVVPPSTQPSLQPFPVANDSPSASFTPILDLIMQNAESGGRIEPVFAKCLYGLIDTLRTNALLVHSEGESASALREELKELRRSHLLLQGAYEALQNGHPIPDSVPLMPGANSIHLETPSLSPSDSVSQGVHTPLDGDSDSESNLGTSGITSGLPSVYTTGDEWSPTPTITSPKCLNDLTWGELRNQTHATYVSLRTPFKGLVPVRALWTRKIVKNTPGNVNVLRRPLRWFVRNLDGSSVPEALSSMFNTMQTDSDTIIRVLWDYTTPLVALGDTRGVVYFRKQHTATWHGAIALMEALHPLLQICMDHWKAIAILSGSLEKLSKEQEKPATDAAVTGSATSNAKPTTKNRKGKKKAANPPVASEPIAAAQPSAPSVPEPPRRFALTKSPNATIRAAHTNTCSPFRPAAKRDHISDPSTPTRPSAKKQRKPIPLSLPSASPASSPRSDVPMDQDNVLSSFVGDEQLIRQTAAAHGLNSHPPSSGPSLKTLASSRLFVDVSHLALPISATFPLLLLGEAFTNTVIFCLVSSLRSWLQLHGTEIPSETIDSMIELVNSMSVDPQHLPRTPSDHARRLKHLLESLNPNNPELDDDDNNDLQFGHSAYSGQWRSATESWDAIGNTEMALALLAGGIRVAQIADFICVKRRVRFPQNVFPKTAICNVYLAEMVDSIKDAWVKSNGAAAHHVPEANPAATAPPPTSSSRSTGQPGPRRGTGKILTSYALEDGSLKDVDPALIPIFKALLREDLPALLMKVKPELNGTVLRSALRPNLEKQIDQLYSSSDATMKASIIAESEPLIIKRQELRAAGRK